MITKEQKFRLGVFLTVSTLLLVIILAIFIIPKLKEEGDIYFINFKGFSVNGVNEGADVKYQGVRIGKVSDIIVNPDDLNSILIYVQLKKNFPVKQDMQARLQYQGITGLRFVEISGGKTDSPGVPIGGEIRTSKGLGEKAEDIVINIDSVVDALNKILNRENREKISGILSNVRDSSQALSNVLQSKQQNIGSSIEKFDRAMGQIVTLSENLTSFSNYLNELKDKGYIDKIAQNSETLLNTLNQRFSKEEFGKILSSMNNLIDTTNTSVKKIEIQLQDLANEMKITLTNMRESMENITRFTRELQEDPTILLRKRHEKRSKK